jgi:hypothetical protein
MEKVTRVRSPERPDDDARFTLGLTLDVVDVLEDHGYPRPDAERLVDLQTALFDFLYGAGGPGLEDGGDR